jgi:hypothetical protein
VPFYDPKYSRAALIRAQSGAGDGAEGHAKLLDRIDKINRIMGKDQLHPKSGRVLIWGIT